jgi:hypothetical protein
VESDNQHEDGMTETANLETLRLTDHELLALLAMRPTRGAEKTRELFRLSGVADKDVLEQAGITTLLVRGLAEVDGDDIVPVDRGAIVAAVVSSADEWLEMALVTPSTDHVLFTAGSDQGSVLLNLSRYGVHEVQPIDSRSGMLPLGIEIARHYLVDGPDGLPAAAMIKHHRADGKPVTAHLKAGVDGSWTLATGDEENPPHRPVPADQAFDEFAAALTFA